MKKEDAVGRVLDLTEDYGCDIYIEGSGKPAAVEQGDFAKAMDRVAAHHGAMKAILEP